MKNKYGDCPICRNMGAYPNRCLCGRCRPYFPAGTSERIRFYARTRWADNGCLLWTSVVNNDGYGVWKTRDGHSIAAHRAAWIIEHGRISQKTKVIHSCDNPPCVNLKHLSASTQLENIRDMVRKGRKKGAKLTPGQVVVIRGRFRAGDSVKTLAWDYGVRKNLIQNLISGRTWKAIV